MKIYLLLILLTLFATSCMNKETGNTTTQSQTTEAKLKHVVLFKFKPNTSAKTIETIETAFNDLTKKIEDIKAFEWGLNNSPEDLNKGFTHCFVLSFDTEAGRANYLPHPDHKTFVNILEPYMEDVLVIDYWAK